MIAPEIKNKKQNIFEHVFYEFDMYLFTFEKLYAEVVKSRRTGHFNQNEYNMAWDAHFLHLRNLIEFFSDTRNCISVDDILCCKYSFEIPEKADYKGESVRFKEVINKTVDHLTIERVEGYAWTEKAIFTQDQMIRIIPLQISKFLEYTDAPANVIDKFRMKLFEMHDMKKKILTRLSVTAKILGGS